MVYSVNSNNTYNQPSMGQISVDTEKLKNNVQNNNNIVSNTMNDHSDKEKGYVAAATVGSWAAISAIMDRFNAKCRTIKVDGKDTSLLHRVQTRADKIGHAVEDTKAGQKILSVFDKTAGWTKSHIINKNKILNAVVNTPAKPEWSSPKMMLNGTLAETAQDVVEAIQKYCINKNVNIETLGITSKQFDKICKQPSKYVGNLIKICKKMPDEAVEVGAKTPLLNKVLRRRVYPSELANKLTVLGKKSIIGETKNLSRLGKSAPKAFLRVVEGLTNGTAGGKIAIFMQAMCFGDAIVRTAKAPKGEKVKTFAESVINDLSFYLMMPLGLSLIYGGCGAKYTGMSKSQVIDYRTRLAKLNKSVADKTISKADYKAEVKALKEMLKGDTKVLKTDKLAIKAKKHITNIVNKPVKAMGKIFSTGLEKISPYVGKDANILDKVKSLPQTVTKALMQKVNPNSKGLSIKGFAGGMMRFMVYMFAISPFLAKQMTKISHLIFGKPTNSILDDNKEETEAEKINENVSITAQQTLNNQQTQAKTQTVQQINYAAPVQKQVVEEPYVRQNLLDKYKNYQPQEPAKLETEKIEKAEKTETVEKTDIAVTTVTTATTVAEAPKKRYIPSTEAVKIPAETKEYSKRYIPSTKAVQADYSEAIERFNKAWKSSVNYEKMAKVQAAAKP